MEAVVDVSCSHTECGLPANGVFSQFGGPNPQAWGAGVPTQITPFQGNRWLGNVYWGPSTFYAWNQGNAVDWSEWTGAIDAGDWCISSDIRRSCTCAGPFGQDVGSTYARQP